MGMEFAIEMVAKASLNKMRVTEVPTILRPDGRTREPHLRTFHDGWRQLRFMLLYSPRWLFLYPGIVLFLGGLIMMVLLASAETSFTALIVDRSRIALILLTVAHRAASYSFSGSVAW